MLNGAGFHIAALVEHLASQDLELSDAAAPGTSNTGTSEGSQTIPVVQDADEMLDVDEGPKGGQDDVVALVKDNPHLEMLEFGSHKRRFPVRCRLCVRGASSKMAVFDAISIKRRKWVDQHLNAPTHRANLKKWQADNPEHADGDCGPDVVQEQTVCQGFSVQGGVGSKLHAIREAFFHWAAYNSTRQIHHTRQPGESQPWHRYMTDTVCNENIIIHRNCERKMLFVRPGRRTMCDKCSSLANDRYIVRMVARFYLKETGARNMAAVFEIWEGRVVKKSENIFNNAG